MPKDQQNAVPWLGFLRPFNALQILYLHDEELGMEIARVLGELSGKSVVEVLPMLHTLILVQFGQVESFVTLLKPFTDAREQSGHPVTMDWRDV